MDTHADYHFFVIVRCINCLYGRLGAGDVYLYNFLGNYSATRSQSLKGTQKILMDLCVFESLWQKSYDTRRVTFLEIEQKLHVE